MQTTFIIFRHGETDWNREHRSMDKKDNLTRFLVVARQ